ncbi:MAG: hypothetical protein ABSA44_09645 [Bacteroidota bacterium]|jgi:hypothetical protein
MLGLGVKIGKKIKEVSAPPAAPGKYWVGGDGDWSDDENHWALTSGGSPEIGNLPTNSDDVFIDKNSGLGSSGTITLDVAANCQNFTSIVESAYNITGTSNYFNIYNSAIFENNLTWNNDTFITFKNNAIDKTIKSNGCIIPYIEFDGGNVSLLDDMVLTKIFRLYNGTFDANNHNVKAAKFYFTAWAGHVPTVRMGSGTWEATGNVTNGDVWLISESDGQVVTIIAQTSTVKLTHNDCTAFNGGGKTYNNLWFAGISTGDDQIEGSNTFNNVKSDATRRDLWFDAGSVNIVNSLTISGNSGRKIVLQRRTDVPIGTWTINCPSGIISLDYVDISDSIATGEASFYAGAHSTDSGGNTGWTFTAPP